MSARDTTQGARISWWPWAVIAAAAAFVTGGFLHPQDDSTLPEAAALADFIGDPLWVPSHALILLSSILFALGLLGLLNHRPELPILGRRAGWVALVASAAGVVEGVPHLGAATESAAAAASQPTPILATHMTLALLVYPLFGFSVAALALLSGRHLTHPLVGALAVIGGIAWGVAPWAVGPLGIEPLGVLFPVGVVLMSAWFAVVGTRALVQRRSGAESSATRPVDA